MADTRKNEVDETGEEVADVDVRDETVAEEVVDADIRDEMVAGKELGDRDRVADVVETAAAAVEEVGVTVVVTVTQLVDRIVVVEIP